MMMLFGSCEYWMCCACSTDALMRVCVCRERERERERLRRKDAEQHHEVIYTAHAHETLSRAHTKWMTLKQSSHDCQLVSFAMIILRLEIKLVNQVIQFKIHLKVQKSFYLGKCFSIFTLELYAILMALNYICNILLAIFNIIICVDSKSVLYALQNWDCKMRRDIVYEVKYMIHYIISRGIGVEFCWVPSHCGLYYWNEISIKLAKQGAMKNMSAISSIIYYYHMRFIQYLKRLCIKVWTEINLRYVLVPE